MSSLPLNSLAYALLQASRIDTAVFGGQSLADGLLGRVEIAGDEPYVYLSEPDGTDGVVGAPATDFDFTDRILLAVLGRKAFR